MEAPHPHPLSSIDRKRPEAYAQRRLNGFWLKHLQKMLGWERQKHGSPAVAATGLYYWIKRDTTVSTDSDVSLPAPT